MYQALSRSSQARPRSTALDTLVLALAAIPLLATQLGAQVFTDITATAGVGLPNTLTESVAWGDYDNDGDEDLYLTSNGPNNLFRNDGGGNFTDVTGIAGVGDAGFSVGTAFGDLDNDGDLDLYVVTFMVGSDVLYRNDGPVGPGGETVFTNIAADAGVTDESSSRGVAFVDYDRDGLLDIYVNAIGPDILYRNLGDLNFENVAAKLGVATVGQGVGVVATDLDNNGWLDLFTGNRSNDPNRLYTNTQSQFTDITVSAGITEIGLGMGVLSLDYDNDLDFDLYWTSWPGGGVDPQPNALYENLGNVGTAADFAHGIMSFVDVATASGTEDALGWGISCNAGDVDNDGWEDFFVTNGFDESTTPNVLFQNNTNGTFTDITAAIGGGDFDGRGVAFADFDNDGDVDLCVTGDTDAETRLWRNDTDNGHRWLTLRLVGQVSNRSAIGARVEVETDLLTQVKEVSSGAGRGSQNSLPVEFGLGNSSTIERVTIRWPHGFVQTLNDVALDQQLTVLETVEIFSDGFESGNTSAW
ncbi:MAG: CRTAC1 family protein [Acidobacteriota bacterium]